MKNIKLKIISFVVGLSVFFNIERLDFGEKNVVDISSYVYILGLAAAVAILAIPPLQRLSKTKFFTFWIFMFLLTKGSVFLYSGRPILGGLYTYLSITEFSLFLILIWLTHRLVVDLSSFETAVRNITFAGAGKRVRQLDGGEEDIQVEIFRSRHNHQPLSVVLVEPDPLSAQETLPDALKEVQQIILHSYATNRVTYTLSKYLRRTDLIFAKPGEDRFVILCPDTNAEDAKLLVEYIQAVAQEQLNIDVDCGLATFPRDAVTFEELMRRAERSLDETTGCKKEKGLSATAVNEDQASSITPTFPIQA